MKSSSVSNWKPRSETVQKLSAKSTNQFRQSQAKPSRAEPSRAIVQQRNELSSAAMFQLNGLKFKWENKKEHCLCYEIYVRVWVCAMYCVTLDRYVYNTVNRTYIQISCAVCKCVCAHRANVYWTGCQKSDKTVIISEYQPNWAADADMQSDHKWRRKFSELRRKILFVLLPLFLFFSSELLVFSSLVCCRCHSHSYWII